MTSNAPPKSVWSRSTRLVKLAAGLAQKELAGRVARAVDRGEELAQTLHRVKVQVEQAKEIVESLGQLKGAAMKAGQLMSMELRDVLPPEVIEVLSQLQSSGATVQFDELRAVLEEELGEKLQQLEVTPTPLASASIGQVHRARWRRPDGAEEELVLKVQFAGIADTIDSDLKLLERIARLFLSTQNKRFDLTATFVELRDVLQRETDYLHEADALEQYRALAHQVPGLKVPRVERSLSTRRVLALSFEGGLGLDALMARAPDAALRQRTAHQLLDLFFREFFQWGLVQTDANFANFLFRPEVGELVLLDFGATRSYPAEFRAHYRALLLASLSGDRARLLAAAQALGLIDAREGAEAQEALAVLLQTVLKVFTDAVQPLDFTDARFVDDAAQRLKAYYQALQFSAPPAQLIFLHRKLGGIYTLGKALKAKVDLAPYRERLATDWAATA